MLSADGTIALTATSVSSDAAYLAYSLSQSGSDWNTIHIMEIATGKILPDRLEWIKFSGMAWYGNGFFYSRYDQPLKGSVLSGRNEYQKVFYHRVGASQQEDQLIHENRQFPLRTYGARVSDDERFLALYESESTSGNALYCRDLSKPGTKLTCIAGNFDHDHTVIDHEEGKLLVLTNLGSPKNRLVLIDPENPSPAMWKTIIPEQEDVLESVTVTGDKLVALYMHHAASVASVFDRNGRKTGDLKLPGPGTISGISGERAHPELYYGFSSFNIPLTIYRCDLKSLVPEVWNKPTTSFDPGQYVVRQEFAESKDGTKIPLFITMKKGLPETGNHPVLLYGYGGFNISLTPSFNVGRIPFLENGGVYVVANIRGGGEYGQEWHKAGTLERKQNVFDDFISVAEYLINRKYTTSGRLAIMGGSNGGLLVGACMTQRPDLFRVAIPQVGVMDMLRYHKFTIGWAWATDYGTSETEEGFGYLVKYSPLHNIRKGVRYPATLAFTADHDDRVVPAHTFKFIAELQSKQEGENPVLIRIAVRSGHGAGKPTEKQIEEATDLWSFLFMHLDMPADD
jgi:prolyl oligopeptidase